MHRLTLTILALLLAGIACAAPQQPARAKARYYYMQGALEQAQGHSTEAYEYYKRAYAIDPAYADAAHAYGLNRMAIRTDSMQSMPVLRESMALMQPYVDAYPQDLTNARVYAYFASRLDTIAEAIRVYQRIDSLRPSDKVNLLQLSDAYMVAHRPDDAIAALQRFESSEGKSPQLSLKKMGFFLAKGDTLAAVAEADDLIATNPREPSYHLLKGNLYEVIGNNDSTLSEYLLAEKLGPERANAKLALASLYRNAGDSASYDNKIYEALLSDDLEITDKTGLLGEYLQDLLDGKADTSRGDHLFDVLMQQFPHQPELLGLAARYSAAKGDFKEAASQMQYAIDLEPAQPQYWVDLMRFQAADDAPADAMETYRRAAQHIDITEPFTLLYASAATMAGQYDEAGRTYRGLLHDINPAIPADSLIAGLLPTLSLTYEQMQRAASIYASLGDMLYKAGRNPEAYTAYENSLTLMPDDPMALNNYAYYLCESGGDLEKALGLSRRSIDAEPDNETYLDTYAWIQFRRKEYAEALQYQEKAIEKATESGRDNQAELYSHLGDILFMNHRPYEAISNWKRALELDPDNQLLKKKVKHKTFFYE